MSCPQNLITWLPSLPTVAAGQVMNFGKRGSMWRDVSTPPGSMRGRINFLGMGPSTDAFWRPPWDLETKKVVFQHDGSEEQRRFSTILKKCESKDWEGAIKCLSHWQNCLQRFSSENLCPKVMVPVTLCVEQVAELFLSCWVFHHSSLSFQKNISYNSFNGLLYIELYYRLYTWSIRGRLPFSVDPWSKKQWAEVVVPSCGVILDEVIFCGNDPPRKGEERFEDWQDASWTELFFKPQNDWNVFCFQDCWFWLWVSKMARNHFRTYQPYTCMVYWPTRPEKIGIFGANTRVWSLFWLGTLGGTFRSRLGLKSPDKNLRRPWHLSFRPRTSK